ncbi:hypothetical protein HMPREF1141_2143 [Clostridium sp. MSTE9]|nr:hypothetical protein HMPREF1141_2143 [Clostridium sp. MSTE9]
MPKPDCRGKLSLLEAEILNLYAEKLGFRKGKPDEYHKN